MKQLLQKICWLSVAVIAFGFNCKAQKLELSAGLNTGASNITGLLATSESYYNVNYYIENKYNTGSIYGHKLTFSYGAYIKAQLVTLSGFIAGADGGYEVLRSKIDLTSVQKTLYFINYLSAPPDIPTGNTPAKGNVILTNQFINLSPYAGYRVKANHVNIDLIAGTEIGFALRSSQQIKVESPDHFNITYVVSKPPTDIRLRGGIAINYKLVALNLSYARGLTNYFKGYPYLQDAAYGKAYSQVIRMGVSYRIR